MAVEIDIPLAVAEVLPKLVVAHPKTGAPAIATVYKFDVHGDAKAAVFEYGDGSKWIAGPHPDSPLKIIVEPYTGNPNGPKPLDADQAEKVADEVFWQPARTIVVGDVHGCIDELNDLLNEVGFNPGDDRLIFVGDLLDRGPNSLGVLRLVHGLGAEVVMGNHEDKYVRYRYYEKKKTELGEKYLQADIFQKKKIEKALAGLTPPSMGSDKTLIYQQLEESDFEFMDTWPSLLELGEFDGDEFVVVHAGLEPSRTLAEQHASRMIRIRWVDSQGEYLKPPSGTLDRPLGGIRWTWRWKGPASVIYGHSTRDLNDPSIEGSKKVRTYGIDTGCVYGGRLTAFILPDRKIVQVPARKAYTSPVLDYD